MKILVVIDVQNDFVSGKLGSDEAKKTIANIVRKLENTDADKIFFTQDTHMISDYNEFEECKYVPIHTIYKSEGWQLVPEIRPYIKDNKVILKESFGSMILADEIHHLDLHGDCPIDEIEIIGFCTDICVLSNAFILQAAVPRSHITVDVSCCAGSSQEKHDIAIKAMELCNIEVRNKGKEPW